MDKSLSHQQFCGIDDEFPVCKESSEGFCFTKKAKLLKVLAEVEAGTNEEKYELWVCLVQCLDRRSVPKLIND